MSGVISRRAAMIDLRVAQDLYREAGSGLDRVGSFDRSSARIDIDRLPGFSPMQLRSKIDKIVDIRHQIDLIRNSFESELGRLGKLEAAEKAGVKELRAAAEKMKDKAQYLVTTEKNLLQFTAYVTEKQPGIKQIIADPALAKDGEKAGGFFIRIAEKLGDTIGKEVESIYEQCRIDTVHATDAVTAFKIVSKTASVSDSTLRKAGLGDVIVSIKDWLVGQSPDSVVGRILNFAGNITKFVRGFAERTKLVKRSSDNLSSAFVTARRDIDNLLR